MVCFQPSQSPVHGPPLVCVGKAWIGPDTAAVAAAVKGDIAGGRNMAIIYTESVLLT